MIRIAAIVVTLALLLGAAFYVGTRFDDASEERARADTLERIGDADVSEGNAEDDRTWVDSFIDSLRSSN